MTTRPHQPTGPNPRRLESPVGTDLDQLDAALADARLLIQAGVASTAARLVGAYLTRFDPGAAPTLDTLIDAAAIYTSRTPDPAWLRYLDRTRPKPQDTDTGLGSGDPGRVVGDWPWAQALPAPPPQISCPSDTATTQAASPAEGWPRAQRSHGCWAFVNPRPRAAVMTAACTTRQVRADGNACRPSASRTARRHDGFPTAAGAASTPQRGGRAGRWATRRRLPQPPARVKPGRTVVPDAGCVPPRPSHRARTRPTHHTGQHSQGGHR